MLEHFAAQGRLAAALDLCLIEVSNWVLGSPVHSGASRLENAGARGVPQIVAPGGLDSVDFCTWTPRSRKREASFRAHNRRIGSSVTMREDKLRAAGFIAKRLADPRGPVRMVMPTSGFSEWDRPANGSARAR